MIESPLYKTRIYVLLLILFIITIACNIEAANTVVKEAFLEKCYPVSREEYEKAAAKLGQSPGTPRYPETAAYYICGIEDPGFVITSVRITDGTAPDEDDDKTEANVKDQNQIPAGSYKGEIINTDMATRGLVEWKVQGTVEKNEIIIHVSDDGTVTGQFSYKKIGNILISDDDGGSHEPCVNSNDQFFTGDASGRLAGNTGKIVFEIQHNIVNKFTEGCSIGPKEEKTIKDIKQHFEIHVNSSEMIGTSILSEEDGHPVKATFRLVKQ